MGPNVNQMFVLLRSACLSGFCQATSTDSVNQKHTEVSKLWFFVRFVFTLWFLFLRTGADGATVISLCARIRYLVCKTGDSQSSKMWSVQICFLSGGISVMCLSLCYLFRCPYQGRVHILPYMAIRHHLSDDPARRSEVTLLVITSEANIQTHRLWAIPSTSNHQRFTYPDGGSGPLTNHGGAEINAREKK